MIFESSTISLWYGKQDTNLKSKIYVLICPFHKCPKYVGQTKNDIKIRLQGHKDESNAALKSNRSRTHKENWLIWLRRNNLLHEVTIHVLEECNINIADEREKYWIMYFRNHYNITNANDGGQLNKSHSSETKQKISTANAGKRNGMYGKTFNHIPETKSKISIALRKSEKFKQHCQSSTFRQKISDAQSEPLIVLNDFFEILGEFRNSKETAKFVGCSAAAIKKAAQFLRKLKKKKMWILKKDRFCEDFKKISNAV